DFIERAENSVKRRDVIWLRKQGHDEKMKVARAVVKEKDLNKKSELLKAFTISGNEFPLSPEILIEYALSENKNLRNVSIDALSYIKADCVHDFSVSQLEKNFSSVILEIFIKNYTKKDKNILLDCLKKLTIDRDNNSGWHGVVLEITNDDTTKVMPDEAIIFVHENSMCSCCREDAVREMIRRNIFNEALRDECLMDCNSDIRTLAENFSI
nr:hypothetical protein [Ruminococcus sp.]